MTLQSENATAPASAPRRATDTTHRELSWFAQKVQAATKEPFVEIMTITPPIAAQTARRKVIYEELHPETKHGSNQHTRGDCNLQTPSFAEATAAAIGRDASTVSRDAARGESISEQALKLVSRTDLDTGVYLDKLKKVEPEKQVDRIRADLEKAAERKELETRNKTANRLVELSDADGCADWLLCRIDLMEVPELVSWLQRVPAKDIIAALSRKAA